MAGVMATDWNALFDRSGERNTWLAADGIYSVSLDGKDTIGSAGKDTKTFFIFSDSFIGSAASNGKMSLASMVNHSAMVLSGNKPLDENAAFYWGLKGDTKQRNNIFGIDEWMFDLMCDGENLYLFGFTHDANWKPERIDMYTVPIVDGEVDLSAYQWKLNISPLIKKTAEKQYVFGMGITPNTETAGVKNSDGYYYFYGYRDNLDYAFFQTKDLIVSRIHENDFPDFSKLTYWNGSEWGTEIEDSAVLIENVSCEVSVTPIEHGPNAGKYIAIYTEGVQSAHMKYALGDSPYGPFDTPVEFYTAPETGTAAVGGNGNLYTYNAKAHPHLSDGNKLLVSYNVNVSMSAAVNCRDYYPRFLYLDLGGEIPTVTTEETTAADTPESTATPTVTSAPSVTTEPPITDETPTPVKKPSGWILPTAIAGGVLLLGTVAVFVIRKRKRKG